MNIEVIALLAVALLALAAAFQLGLAAGAPWGAAAYGGRAVPEKEYYRGVSPRQRRRSAATPRRHVGRARVRPIVGRGPVSFAVLTVVLWCLAALFGLNTLGNSRGRHPLERWGASTVTAILAILCALIAAN